MVAAASVLAALLTSAPSQSTSPARAENPGDEFPPQDQRISWSLQQAITTTLAAERLRDAPDDPETVRLLARASDRSGLVQALRAIVDTRAERIADAFEAFGDALYVFRGDDSRSQHEREALRAIVEAARAKLTGLSREDAARVERVLLEVDAEFSHDRNTRAALEKFVEQYRSTDAALLAEVDLLPGGLPSEEWLSNIDAFVTAHPGTSAAAKALYQKGFQLAHNASGRIEPFRADPTARMMRVAAIASELESGRYPASEWVAKASSLVTGLYISTGPPIPAENVDRLITIYQDFAAAHIDRGGLDASLEYLITSEMADLFGRRGERTAGMERAFANLEQRAADRSVIRYLHGLFYLQSIGSSRASERDTNVAHARRLLTALAAEGAGLYHRKALAAAASLDFAEGRYADARVALRGYAERYPSSPWTWVARFRSGQCELSLGDARAAASTFRAVAGDPAIAAPARALGHAHAARAYEALGDFENALVEWRRGRDAWLNVFEDVYAAFDLRPPKSPAPFALLSADTRLNRQTLDLRVAHLTRAVETPGGVLVERGRQLIALARDADALATLGQAVNQSSKSPAASDARYLIHLARLQQALRPVLADAPGANESAALAELERLSREPHDFATAAAAIAEASILARRGESSAAQATMRRALTEWHARQRVSALSGGLDADVAAIRSVVFRPLGAAIFATGHWNAFSWPSTPSPFWIVNANAHVTLHDGTVTRVTLVQELASADRVLFFDRDQIAILQTLIVGLGGTRTRQPQHVMETPNQPVGDSMTILGLWNSFFPARPGHWGGWELETYPVITDIRFDDANRTRAAVRVTIGYSGATVELEKESGIWIMKRLTSHWIT